MDDMNRFARELQQNPNVLRSLMQSTDGQALMRMLSGKDGGAALQQAARSAMQGDAAQLSQMVQNLMASPGGAQLVERTRQAAGK